jgi:F0F1-type ATP synthase assembly protein I
VLCSPFNFPAFFSARWYPEFVPDDPLDKDGGNAFDPEKKLRDLFERIEREEAQRAPTSEPIPELPVVPEASRAAIPGDDSTVEDALRKHAADLGISPDEVRLAELQKEFEAVAKERDDKVEGIQTEFDSRMSNLDSRIKKMQSDREEKKAVESKVLQDSASSAKGLGLGLTVAYTFIGCPLMGALIGWGIDQWRHTDIYKGIFMMVGAAGGLALVVMFLKRADAQK